MSSSKDLYLKLRKDLGFLLSEATAEETALWEENRRHVHRSGQMLMTKVRFLRTLQNICKLSYISRLLVQWLRL